MAAANLALWSFTHCGQRSRNIWYNIYFGKIFQINQKNLKQDKVQIYCASLLRQSNNFVQINSSFLVMFIIECGFSVVPHQEIFKNRDTDNSGTMSSHEMRDAVKEAGNESMVRQ